MTTKTKTTVMKLTKKKRLEEMQAFVELCFASLDPDYKEIANATGLHVSTIYRLATGRFTLNVRVGTIQALGAAAGLMLTMTKRGATVRVVD